MKALTREWVKKAEGDWDTAARELRARKRPNYDSACFHAQQCVEKYFKAALAEVGQSSAKIHDLDLLLAALLPSYPLWTALQHHATTLTLYAVQIRYPGTSADRIMAKEAVALCRLIRNTIRQQFGLPTAPAPVKRKRRTGGKKAIGNRKGTTGTKGQKKRKSRKTR